MPAFLKLNLNDWQKALIVAILTSPITLIYNSLQSGVFDFDWKKILAAALTGGIGYLLKNFLTNSQGQILTTEPEINEMGNIIRDGKFLGVFNK
jgi:hypothetical protein